MIGITEIEGGALVAAVASVTVAAISLAGSWLQQRKTRRKNTEEHNVAQQDRLASETRLAGRLDSIDGHQRHMVNLLVDHVSDREAHGRGVES